jgi:hypothetical protein
LTVFYFDVCDFLCLEESLLELVMFVLGVVSSWWMRCAVPRKMRS